MYKLISSAKGSDDLSIGFNRNRNTRETELTKKKNIKSENHLRVMLKDIFGLAEYQKKLRLV